MPGHWGDHMSEHGGGAEQAGHDSTGETSRNCGQSSLFNAVNSLYNVFWHSSPFCPCFVDIDPVTN